MAEIEIQKKHRPRAAAWVFGVLVLALVVWGIAEYIITDEASFAEVETIRPGMLPLPPVDVQPGEVPQMVQQFVSDCGTATPYMSASDMGRDHVATVSCMQLLGNGIESVLHHNDLQDEGVTTNLNHFRTAVQELQASAPSSTQHAELARAAAMRAVDAIENARTRWYADRNDVQSAIAEARTAAERISEETSLLEQRDELHAFFRESGELLHAIATGPGAN